MRLVHGLVLFLVMLQRPVVTALSSSKALRMRRHNRHRHRHAQSVRDAPQDPPRPPVGTNTNMTRLRQICPNRDYQGCWGPALRRRYNVTDLLRVGAPDAAANARRIFGTCVPPPRSQLSPAALSVVWSWLPRLASSFESPASGQDSATQLTARKVRGSFVMGSLLCAAAGEGPCLGANSPDGQSASSHERLSSFESPASLATFGAQLSSAVVAHRRRFGALRAHAGTAHNKNSALPAAGLATAAATPLLHCASDTRSLRSGLLLLLGVPSQPGPKGRARRAAARASWMKHRDVGRRVVVCFLLSTHYQPAEMAPLLAEAGEHGDMLFLRSAETSQLLKGRTRYSNFTKLGRGMPTFKQHCFFRYVANALQAAVPFVGKVDDDSAVNLHQMVPLLDNLRCVRMAFVAAINWAAPVPQADWSGVRSDRCGFGWGLGPALSNFGKAFGDPAKPGFQPACDTLGAVPPLPYGTGAGYLFSGDLIHWLGTSPEINAWVAAARGAYREDWQWQKFEDLTTGYWLSFAPEPVQYVKIDRWVHDFACHPEGARKLRGGGLYRPPSNATLVLHNLKNGGFNVGYELMQPDAPPYDHGRCKADRLLLDSPHGLRDRANGASPGSAVNKRKGRSWRRRHAIGHKGIHLEDR